MSELNDNVPVPTDAVPQQTPQPAPQQQPKPKKLRTVAELIAKLGDDTVTEQTVQMLVTAAERQGCASTLALLQLSASPAALAEGRAGVPWMVNGRPFILKPEVWYLVPRWFLDNVRAHRDYSAVMAESDSEDGVQRLTGATRTQIVYPHNFCVL